MLQNLHANFSFLVVIRFAFSYHDHCIYYYAVLEMLAQCQMIWMLLGISVGWTVTPNSRHPIRDRKELTINLTVTIIHVRRITKIHVDM